MTGVPAGVAGSPPAEARRGTLTTWARKHLWLVIGFALLLLGYILLAAGDISAAPLLLVAGYCVFIPIHLYRSFRGKS